MPKREHAADSTQIPHVEQVEIQGHIIDSLILPKVLDLITSRRWRRFAFQAIAIGQARNDPSYALFEVRPPRPKRFFKEFSPRSPTTGPCRRRSQDCRLVAGRHGRRLSRGLLQHDQPADRDPPRRPWIDVEDQEMDCGVVVDRRRAARAACR